MEDVWNMFGRRLEQVWKVFRGSLENFCMVSGKYLGNINIILSVHNTYMQIFEYASMKVGKCKYVGMQIYKHASIHVCKYENKKAYK